MDEDVVIKTEPLKEGDMMHFDDFDESLEMDEGDDDDGEEDVMDMAMEQTDFSMFKVKREIADSYNDSLSDTNTEVAQMQESYGIPDAASCSKGQVFGNELRCHFDNCGRVFSRQQALSNHERSHWKNELMIQVAACIKSEAKDDDNQESKALVCEGCNFHFKIKHALVRHKRKNSSAPPYGCSVCLEEYPMECMLKKHSKECYQQFSCETCEFKTISKYQLDKHVKDTHTAIVKTDETEIIKKEPEENGDDSFKVFLVNQNPSVNTKKLKSQVEMIEENGVKKFRCPVKDCTRSFLKQCGLTVHLKTHGMKQSQDAECKYCGRKFLSRKAAKFHARTRHEQTDRYKCEVEGCGRSFGVKDTLRKHMISHGEKMLKCDGCNAPFKYPHALRRHQVTKTANAPYTCEKCGQLFDMDCQLQQHTLAFHNPFVCDVCGAVGMNKTDLVLHQKDQHRKKKSRCSYPGCGVILMSKYEASQHQFDVHGGSEGPEQRNQVFCRACSATFLTEESLKEHVEKHPAGKAYMCRESGCDIFFRTFCGMNMHRIRSHRVTGDGMKCFHEGCLETFSSVFHLRNHMDDAHHIESSEHLYHCDKENCLEGFRFQYLLDEHRHVHKKSKSVVETLGGLSGVMSEDLVFKRPLVCTVCEKQFDTLKGIRLHLGSIHSHQIRFGCGIEGCDKVFTNVRYFAYHRRKNCEAAYKLLAEGKELPYSKLMSEIAESSRKYRVRPSKTYSCNQCDKVFKVGQSLRIHKRLRHNADPKWFVCNINGCGKKFRVIEYLRRHKKSHQRFKTIACTYPGCDKTFKYLHGMRRHYLIHVKPKDAPPPETHECPEEGCSRVFACPRSLKEHIEGHRGTYDCKICGKKIMKRFTLKLHMSIHEQKKSHACDINGCNKKFHHVSHLKRHKKYHDQSAKKYDCPFPGCKARFFYPTQQRQHIESHTKGKTYSCNWAGCNRIFQSEHNRKQHIRWHALQKKPMFTCDIENCDMSFTTNYGLKRHIKNIHIAKGREKFYGCPISWCPRAYKEYSECQTHIQDSHKLYAMLKPTGLGYPNMQEILDEHNQRDGDDVAEEFHPEVSFDEAVNNALMSGLPLVGDALGNAGDWNVDEGSSESSSEDSPPDDNNSVHNGHTVTPVLDSIRRVINPS